MWKAASCFLWKIKWNGPFSWKIIGKKGIPSEEFFFSRFLPKLPEYITAPFAASSHLYHAARVNYAVCLWKIVTVPFGGKFPPVFPYKKNELSILWCCALWWGGLRTLTTPRAMSAGAYAPGRFTHAKLVYGRGARLNRALQVGG